MSIIQRQDGESRQAQHATELVRPVLPRRLRLPGLLQRGVRPYLLTLDVCAFALVSALAPLGPPAHLLLLLALYLLSFAAEGLYRPRLDLAILDDLPHLLKALVLAGGLQAGVLAALSVVNPLDRQLQHAAALFGAVLVLRGLAYASVRALRRSGRARHRTLVIGAGHVGIRLTCDLLQRRQYGLDPVGFIDSHPRIEDPARLPVPLLGGYERLAQIIDVQRVHVVVVAFGKARGDELVDVLRTCDRLQCEVFIVPRLFELNSFDRGTDEVWGTPLRRVRRATFRTRAWRFKRCVDVVVAAIALVGLSPLLAGIAMAVRLDGGPILFRQERVGLDGRLFQLLKFRSLAPVDPGEAAVRWNIRDDARLGRVGRFLRRTSLDELPQLWNILVGDMSLVGPRPERPYFVSEFASHIPRYLARHRVPAGLTGWAQVHGLRGDTSIEDRARFDNYYIENWSPWLDMKIVLRTLGQVVRRAGG